MLMLDSDVLFFETPTELLRRIEDPGYRFNTFNGDIASAYTVDPAAVEQGVGFRLQERFNSGLGLLHRASLRLDWIEAFLGLPGMMGNEWLIEQTVLALCSSRFGVELLPSAYDVHFGRAPDGAPCRHYVGLVRHLMYGEGMVRLARRGFVRI
jgi:hypothetical protein